MPWIFEERKMRTSEITYSQLDKRFLSAEYYKKEYLNNEKLLDRMENLKTLKDIAISIKSGTYVRKYVDDGTLYLRVNNIRENDIDLTDVKFVDIERSKIPDEVRVKANDVLLTRTGTIGLSCVAPRKIEGAVISQHLTRITLKQDVNPFYVAVFLNTKLGRMQTERGVAGSVQKELIHNIQKSIKIPILLKPFQDTIAQMVKKASNLRSESEKLNREAKQAVEQELFQLLQSKKTLIEFLEFV